MGLNEQSQIIDQELTSKLYESSKSSNLNEPNCVLKGMSEQRLLFNVMPNLNVTENLLIKEYRIWDHAIEAVFDRHYETDMAASPNHLIFLSALINLQKMVYVYMNHYLGIKYDPKGPETLKVWPTELNLSMPKLLTDTKGITHRLNVKMIRKIENDKFYMIADTFIGDSLIINGKALILKL